MKAVKPYKIQVFLATAGLLLFWFGLSNGSVALNPMSLNRLLNPESGETVSRETYRMIILDFRLPRMIMALIIGMMLSSSGVVVQAVFRNPLADPYLIGISASAVTGAVIAFLLGLPEVFYGILAFTTSLVVTFLIFRLSMSKGTVSVAMLLIIGIAVSSFMSAFTSFALYWIGEDSYRITVWLMGYLGGATWSRVIILIIPLMLALSYFYYHRIDLDALLRGDEEAHSLGIDTAALKKRLLAVASLIAAFSVAFSGMIGFVGLIIPHTVRLIVGSNHHRLLTYSAVGGGLFLLAADILARTLLAPVEIPIGVVTSFFGAPFFLYLAVKQRGGISL
ncbi:MAG: iron ABC transporter permease [Spirochaetales bacterium]|nr:iron ABC transporter permease [Spirochaetales bacterium]